MSKVLLPARGIGPAGVLVSEAKHQVDKTMLIVLRLLPTEGKTGKARAETAESLVDLAAGLIKVSAE